MKTIFNALFYICKFIFLIVSFGLVLFILIRLNMRLNKEISTIFSELIPFFIILVLFIINLIFRQESVTKNVFYNLTCCLVLITISLVSFRAFYDENLVLREKYGYGIDFNFFDNFIAYIKILLYGLIISDILFMFNKNFKENK